MYEKRFQGHLQKCFVECLPPCIPVVKRQPDVLKLMYPQVHFKLFILPFKLTAEYLIPEELPLEFVMLKVEIDCTTLSFHHWY